VSTLIWSPDPGDVEMRLREEKKYKYPANARKINLGYGSKAVVPLLYGRVCELGDLPGIADMCNYLWQFREDVDKRHLFEVKMRTIKLVIDFYRELHTFGLLVKHPAFGLVRYKGAVDVDLGVDFIVRLSKVYTHWSSIGDIEIGVQAQCRLWPNGNEPDVLSAKKEWRKRRRGAGVWEGSLYHLTNRQRPALVIRPISAWLFTPDHIKDLVKEITLVAA
jgi:hypothetical protein